MTKKQLWRELAGVPDDAELVMASDAEGNEFRPLAEVAEGVYIPISDERGDFFNNDEESDGEGIPAVCLWPEG
jgi:hypothetical protein